MGSETRDMASVPADTERRMVEFTARCRELGLKLTHQRLQIFKVLASHAGHPSAEVVHSRLSPGMPTLSLDTVYRTLVTFEKHGLIGRVEVLDDRARFDANLTAHHHLVCTRCRSVVDFYWPALDRLDLPEETEGWGVVDGRHLELRGLCSRCVQR